MARIALLLSLCLTLTGALASGAGAITNGTLDGDAHPYAAALVAGGGVVCSATLVSPTVAVTAGHCVAGLTSPRVALAFDSQLVPGAWALRAGTAHLDSAYGTSRTDSHDLAVVVLDEGAPVAAADLPALGAADGATATTAVGYGYHDRAKGDFLYDGARRVATTPVKRAGATTLDVGDRTGGVCFGDSGGPHLLGDTVVAITSTGTKSCNGTAEAYRLDTAPARSFLARFVPLP